MKVPDRDSLSGGKAPDIRETRNPGPFGTAIAALFAYYPDGWFLQSGGGKILSCNSALCNLTGYTHDELCSMIQGDLFRDRMFKSIMNSLKEKKKSPDIGNIRIEGMCTRKDGTRFPAEITLALCEGDESPSACVIVRDITRERMVHDENRRLHGQLRHAQTMETIGQMIGGISHYFNNVFTGILGNLSLAGIDAPEGLSPFIGNAAHAADRARTFTRQLLSLSRKSVVVLEPTDIGALIEDVESFARLTFDRRIEIAVAKPDCLHCVLADAASIHHVLLNLCINARDAIEEKHVTLSGMTEPRITVEACNETVPARCDADQQKNHGISHPDARPGRYVRITVSDNGCGMDEESIKRIFEPYYTTKEPGKGTGLGLAVALETIRQHNGWIECASTAGQGTAFTVYLPATSLKKEISGERKAVDLPPGTERVLFVDDEEMVRTFGILTLERLGYSVLSASNGREALDLYIREHGSIDLVILDLGLPVLSGQELLKHIRLINRDVTVLILSGHDFVHDRDVFGELRADDYILKPFTIYDLATSVRTVLDRKSGR